MSYSLRVTHSCASPAYLPKKVMEQWSARMGPDRTLLIASFRDHSLMAAWSSGDTAGPQVFL